MMAATLNLFLLTANLVSSFTATPSRLRFVWPSSLPTAGEASLVRRSASNGLISTTTTRYENRTLYDPASAFTDSTPELVDLLTGGLEEKDEEYCHSPDSINDIVKDLDCRPLTTEYLAKAILGANEAAVQSYYCPENDAFRGIMSNACRIRLVPGGQTAFYKRVVFKELDHAWEKLKTAPFKLKRDSKSYEVVAKFLASKACEEVMRVTGVRIPKCYDAQLRPSGSSSSDDDGDENNVGNPIESKFSFLLEDFAPWDGWYQQWLICDVEECEATLETFAKIHAFFWNGSEFWEDEVAGRELEGAIWKSGSYVQPHAQNTNTIDQCKIVAKEWATKRMKFQKELSPFDFWDNLGERLESMAESCGRLAHPFADSDLSEAYKKYRTFTHGDPKSANIFFRRREDHGNDVDDDRDGDKSDLEVGLIDFQWTGFGLAATDIAHFMTSAVHSDLLVNGGEKRLLKIYFDNLQKYLVEYGAYDSADEAFDEFSYDTFLDQYEIGVLDICRLMISYTWSRFKEPVEKGDKEGCERTMNKTSYNKSVCTIVWLLKRCDEIMKSRGV